MQTTGSNQDMDGHGNTDFERLRKEPDLGLELAGAISSSHGLSSDCAIVTVRSQLVFSSAEQHIIKVFAPRDADFHKAETVFLTNLYGRLPIPTPGMITSGYWEDLPYIIMEKLRGIPLDRVWSGLRPAEQRRVIEQIGEGIRDLHSLPAGLFTEVPFKWDPFIDHQQAALLDNHRRYGLDQAWVDQLGTYMDACPLAPHDPARIGPLHTELMQEHIFVKESSGRWTVSGLIDFEPSMAGHVEYEFPAVGLFLTQGNRDLLRCFLAAYGYRTEDLDREFSRRLMGFMLLHRYSNLTWFLTFLPSGLKAARLEHLEQFWFGV
jgi:hygromycin-B 7''-O-kinase